MIEDYLFILVLYEKALNDSESFNAIQKQLAEFEERSDFLVYDNSINRQQIATYSKINIEYVHDSSNSGISYAYNVGAKYANHLKKKWIILLDQDTEFEKNYIKSTIDSIMKNPEMKIFAPILKIGSNKLFSPCTFKFNRGFLIKSIEPGIKSLQEFSPVNSGMIINLNLFNEVGGYNERVKLDFSDFQFIEKVKKKISDFYVLPSESFQNFSDVEKDVIKLNKRFFYYCEGAKNFERQSFLDSILFFIVCFQRMIFLMIKNQSFIFVKTFLKSYILRRK